MHVDEPINQCGGPIPQQEEKTSVSPCSWRRRRRKRSYKKIRRKATRGKEIKEERWRKLRGRTKRMRKR